MAESGIVKEVRFEGSEEAAATNNLTASPLAARRGSSKSPRPSPHRMLRTRATCPNLDAEDELRDLRHRLSESARGGPPSLRASPGPLDKAEGDMGPPASPLPGSKPPRPLSITPIQMNLLRKSWANAKTRGKMEPIANIFHHATFKCPEMRTLLERSAPGSGTKEHIHLFLELFENLMDSLEDTSRISLQLRSIGKEHVRLWESGFRAAHFDILIQSLLDATLKWGEKPVRTADCQVAWAEVCSFIVEELKEGFHEARKLTKRKASLKNLPS